MTATAKTFTALGAAATLGLAAFATAQPAQAHHHYHHHRHVGVFVAPVGPAYACAGAYGCSWKRQRVLDSWADMCVAYESAFKNQEQRQ
jgi:hypothetical protein